MKYTYTIPALFIVSSCLICASSEEQAPSDFRTKCATLFKAIAREELVLGKKEFMPVAGGINGARQLVGWQPQINGGGLARRLIEGMGDYYQGLGEESSFRPCFQHFGSIVAARREAIANGRNPDEAELEMRMELARQAARRCGKDPEAASAAVREKIIRAHESSQAPDKSQQREPVLKARKEGSMAAVLEARTDLMSEMGFMSVDLGYDIFASGRQCGFSECDIIVSVRREAIANGRNPDEAELEMRMELARQVAIRCGKDPEVAATAVREKIIRAHESSQAPDKSQIS